jgi:hypothetical protein
LPENCARPVAPLPGGGHTMKGNAMPTRRHFLAASAATPAALAQTVRPNDKIRLALIGAGGMGSGDVNTALSTGLAELVAVADIYDGRLVRAREAWGAHIQTTRDYRELLVRKDIDAVIIGTPDHWHARIAIDAMNAGKDVYVEKPMVQKVDDGQGPRRPQERPHPPGGQPARLLHRLRQGPRPPCLRRHRPALNLVEAWWDRNSAIGAWQYSDPARCLPANIDWDRFLGAAPKRPFEPVRLFRWRNYQDYGTGVAGDLFVHLFSGLHFITGVGRTGARLRHRRPPLLEGRPRRARRHDGPLRLSGAERHPPSTWRCASTSSTAPARPAASASSAARAS